MQYACMRCTPGELRRCLFWHQAAPYPNAIFVAFVRDPLSHDSRRFAFRLAAEPFGSALFFTQPCGLRCARSRRLSLFLRAAFFAAFESAPGHAFLAGDSTFFSWSLAQDHFRCWTCPGAFPGRVRRRRGRTARTCGLTLFSGSVFPVECSRAVFWRCFLRHRATSQARQYDAESSRQAFIFIWTNLHD